MDGGDGDDDGKSEGKTIMSTRRSGRRLRHSRLVGRQASDESTQRNGAAVAFSLTKPDAEVFIQESAI